MNPERLNDLRIASEVRRRPRGALWSFFGILVLLTGTALYFAWPRASDQERLVHTTKAFSRPGSRTNGNGSVLPSNSAPAQAGPASAAVLTVSGYIINRERIELSPRFMGLVKWIGVKKGDSVTNGQVVVLLDDAEYRARLAEAEARLLAARTAVERAELAYARTAKLARDNVESRHVEDEARLNLAASRAAVAEIEGQIALLKTYLDWTIIRSPIDGVVLEKLVDPNELVTPQSFGGSRGPSTALIAVANPNDLQVEIDMNEADLSKVRLGQPCRVSPEAYPDHRYEGLVAEIAPEATRQKGTLQIKVQILHPDKYLTPELSARVDFLETKRAGDR